MTADQISKQIKDYANCLRLNAYDYQAAQYYMAGLEKLMEAWTEIKRREFLEAFNKAKI